MKFLRGLVDHAKMSNKMPTPLYEPKGEPTNLESFENWAVVLPSTLAACNDALDFDKIRSHEFSWWFEYFFCVFILYFFCVFFVSSTILRFRQDFPLVCFQTVLALGSPYLSCIEGDLYARTFESFSFTCLDLRKPALNIRICDSFLVTCVDLPRHA